MVGSANVDLVTFNDTFPRPGETIFGKKFDMGFGGKGANQAVAARRCGAAVGMVAKVGSDLFGPATVKNFEALGIDAGHVRMAEGISTGVAPIFVDPSGQNRIVVIKGANETLSPVDVDAAAPLLRQAGTILLQFEIPLATVYYTIQFAKSHGIRCIVNPAPASAAGLQADCCGGLLRAERERSGGHHRHSRSHYRRRPEMRRVICWRGESPRSSLLWASAARCWRQPQVWN